MKEEVIEDMIKYLHEIILNVLMIFYKVLFASLPNEKT